MRYFYLLFTGALITSIGTGMTTFALSVDAFQTYGTASVVAAIQLAGFAPLVLTTPIAGVLADRFDRRILMIIGDGGSMLGLALVLWNVTQPDPQLSVTLVGLVLSSLLAGCTEPALRATVSDVVPPTHYQRSSGLLQIAASSKFLLSPIMAAGLLAIAGLPSVLVLDMSTCIITVGCTILVRRAIGTKTVSGNHDSIRAELLGGYHIITQTQPVWTVVMIFTALIVVLGGLQTLFKPILLPLTSVSMESIAESISATGLIAGGAVVSILSNKSPWRLISLGAGLIGVGMLLLPLVPHPAWITLAAFVVFFALAVVNAGGDVVVRTHIPNAFQGRVWGVIGFISQLGFLVAYLITGPLADLGFEPLLAQGGLLANSLGSVIGSGPGRGSALLVGISGFGALGLSLLAKQVGAALATRATQTGTPPREKPDDPSSDTLNRHQEECLAVTS
ncbi:MFS transporter [Stomatohabitans albus]|uniref:MFS transporter n=1 Tax=Stomatohabitans albus TaxID=3110766 RepID=UPI00300D2BBC